MVTIKELKESGYNVILDDELMTLEIFKTDYYDNGEGYNFYYDVCFTGTKKEFIDGMFKITVDDLTLEELEIKFNESVDKCKLWTIFNKCSMNEFEELTKKEQKLITGDCSDCQYYEALILIFETYDMGNF